MRVPVPLVPGQRVTLGAFGFAEFGHGEYTKYKVPTRRIHKRLSFECTM
jgi:hypothetical protein